jgi:hypothetical protein
MEAYIAETDIKCAVHKPSLSDLMFCNIISIAVRNMPDYRRKKNKKKIKKSSD